MINLDIWISVNEGFFFISHSFKTYFWNSIHLQDIILIYKYFISLSLKLFLFYNILTVSIKKSFKPCCLLLQNARWKQCKLQNHFRTLKFDALCYSMQDGPNAFSLNIDSTITKSMQVLNWTKAELCYPLLRYSRRAEGTLQVFLEICIILYWFYHYKSSV